MPTRRIVISAAITGFWLVMMGLLLRNYLLPRGDSSDAVEVSPGALTEDWRDYEEWMRLTIAGRSDGVSYTTVRRRTDRSGYIAANRIRLDLGVLGGQHAFRLETVASLNSLFQMDRVTAEVRLDDAELKFAALSNNLRFLYRLQYEGQTRVGSQNLEKPISLLEAVRPLAARQLDLKVGNAYRLPVLDSTWSLREGNAEVKVQAREKILIGGRSYDAFRLVTSLGPYASTTWVSPEGEMLRREFAGNIRMERMDPEKGRERFPGIDAPVEIPKFTARDFLASADQASSATQDIAPLNLLVELFRQPAGQR